MADDIFPRVPEKKSVKYSVNNVKNTNTKNHLKNCDTHQNNSITHVPETKWIQVYINGDEHFSGYRCVVNTKYFRSFEVFLNHLTERLQPSFGAVRNIYTPINGHSVSSLEDLMPNQKYVVAGSERFKRLEPGYADIGEKSVKRAIFKPKSKYRVLKAKPQCHYAVTIFLYKNGNYKMKPHKLMFYNEDLESWDTVFQKASERLKCGAIKRICSLYGEPVKSIVDFVNNQSYVVIGKHEIFKNGNYSNSSYKYSSSKDLSSCSRQLRRSSSIMHSRSSAQSYSSITIGMSLMSCANDRTSVTSSSNVVSNLNQDENGNIIDKWESNKLRERLNLVDHDVQSLKNKTFEESFISAISDKYASNIPADTHFSTNHDKKDFQDIIFHEKADSKLSNASCYDENSSCIENCVEKIKKFDLDDDFSGIYRAKTQNLLTIGAVEIEDDIETAINLPIDLLEAEEVEDEVIPEMEASIQHLNLDVSEEIVAFLPHMTKKQSAGSERKVTSKNYNLSGSQTLDIHNIYA